MILKPKVDIEEKLLDDIKEKLLDDIEEKLLVFTIIFVVMIIGFLLFRFLISIDF